MNFLAGELVEIGEQECVVKLTSGDTVRAGSMPAAARSVTRWSWAFVPSTWCRWVMPMPTAR
jgi:hypothetical protein